MSRFLASVPIVVKPFTAQSPSDLADLGSFAALIVVVFVIFSLLCLDGSGKASRFVTIRLGLAILAFGICSCDAYFVLTTIDPGNVMEKAMSARERLAGGLVMMTFMLVLHTSLWVSHPITKQPSVSPI